MTFFTLNFYTKVLLLAILLAVGVWNRKFTSDKANRYNNQLAAKQIKQAGTKNILATTLNKF